MVSPAEVKALGLITELYKSNTTFMKNLENDIKNTKENNNTMVIALIITALAAIFVALRMYARAKQRGVGIEDWFALAGTVLTVGHCAIVVNADLYGGIGRPAWSTSVAQFSMALRMMFWSFMTYPTMMGLIRASILLFYRRLFGPTYTTHQLIVKILLVLLIPATITFTCLSALMCKPIQAAWNPWERAGTCKNMFYQKFVMGMYCTSLAFDVIILLLPLRAVWKLQLPDKQKLGVAVMLLCGSSACIAVIGRIIAFQIIYNNIRYNKIDPRWIVHPLAAFLPPGFDKQDIGYWIPAQFEPCVALIGSSLPSLRYYFRRDSGTSTDGSRSSGRLSGKEKKHYIDTASDSTTSLGAFTNRDVESTNGMEDSFDLDLQPTLSTTSTTSPGHVSRTDSDLSTNSSSSRKKGWYRYNHLHTSDQSLEERHREALGNIEMQGGLDREPLTRDGSGIVVTTNNTTTVSTSEDQRIGAGRPRGYDDEWRLSRNSSVIYTPPG